MVVGCLHAGALCRGLPSWPLTCCGICGTLLGRSRSSVVNVELSVQCSCARRVAAMRCAIAGWVNVT